LRHGGRFMRLAEMVGFIPLRLELILTNSTHSIPSHIPISY